jgi:2-polyprenyl-3-methyl-5-hydroxy-6-metoxy-1,4-benzoquinol methylase
MTATGESRERPGGSAGGTGASAKASKAKALAFYLPQFHPIPENDEWWGKGFTEWTNVTKAKPLYPGHYQPHVPGELGYYDLRVPEVREAQAALAREYGIHGFIYYHYWFHGKRLLERPFEEVLASGSPDFPFALCWANEPWTRNWDAQTGRTLMAQEFSDEDDRAHIHYLCKAFADDRYIKIDGRPLMMIYRAKELPDAARTARIWREEAQKLGFPDIYLCWVESWGPPEGGPQAYNMDATSRFIPQVSDQIFTPLDGVRGHRILDYETAFTVELRRPKPKWRQFPSVMVGWDNTARRQRGATIYSGATPAAYERWLRDTVKSVADVREEENYLFIVAWNEWAEGNHLEPDQRYGRAFLEATKAVLVDGQSEDELRPGQLRADDDATEPADSHYNYVYAYQHESAVANAAGLVRDLHLEPDSTVVDLGAGTAVVSHALREAGIAYHGLELHPVAVELMQSAGISAAQCDLTDTTSVKTALNEVGDVGAMLLLDVIEHLVDPQQLLSALSAWSLEHENATLVVSVPNAAHFDLGLQLLSGRWVPTETGLLDSTHLRFFTEETLTRLLERCGWRAIARDNFEVVRSDQFDPELNDALPAEMIGALRVLSDSFNPNAAVQQFVWALKPFPVSDPPSTFLQAVGAPGKHATNGAAAPEEDAGESQVPDVDRGRLVEDYLLSVGIVASEKSRRSVIYGDPLPSWKRAIIKAVYHSPRTEAAFKKAYGMIR